MSPAFAGNIGSAVEVSPRGVRYGKAPMTSRRAESKRARWLPAQSEVKWYCLRSTQNHRVTSHNSKTVLATVKIGPPPATRGVTHCSQGVATHHLTHALCVPRLGAPGVRRSPPGDGDRIPRSLFQVGQEGVVAVKAGDGADELAEGGGAPAQVVELVGNGDDRGGALRVGAVEGEIRLV